MSYDDDDMPTVLVDKDGKSIPFHRRFVSSALA